MLFYDFTARDVLKATTTKKKKNLMFELQL